jgi:transmembrane sensor
MAQGAPDIIVTDELLSRYFAGEALPEEAMAIDDWKALNAENASEFEACWNAWNATTPTPYQRPEIPAAWAAVQQQIAKPVKKLFPMRWVAAAAAVAGIVIVTLLFLQKNEPAADMIVKAAGTTMKKQTLSDGSVISIDAGSSISYAAGYGETDRVVSLRGSAGFDVQPLPHKPFIVKTGPLQVKVLGTTFHVTETDSLIRIKVRSGKVQAGDTKDSVTLTAGQTAQYIRKTQQFVQPTYSFKFENAALGAVVARLSDATHQKIVLSNPALASLKISSNFENEPLDYILEVITTTLDLKYSYSDNDEIHIEE